MARPSEGAWVAFRIQVRPVSETEFPPGTRMGGPPPNPFVRIKDEMFKFDCPGGGGSGSIFGDDSGGLLVGSYVSIVELGPAPPKGLNRDLLKLIGKSLYQVVADNASAIRENVRQLLNTFPSPSASGQAPGSATGVLAHRIEIHIDDDGMGASIGSSAPYAKWLECGRLPNVAAHPFLYNALEARKDRLKGDIDAAVFRTFGISTGLLFPTDRMGFPKLTEDGKIDRSMIWLIPLSQAARRPVPKLPEPSETSIGMLREWAYRELDKLIRLLSDMIGPPNLPGPPPPGPFPIPVPGRFPKRR